MSFLKAKSQKTELEKAIDSILIEMSCFSANDPQYNDLLGKLERLHKLNSNEKKEHRSVSPDALLAVIGNLTGIGMILGYEQAHVVTSKALGFVTKPKV
jgi:hypothetical protein